MLRPPRFSPSLHAHRRQIPAAFSARRRRVMFSINPNDNIDSRWTPFWRGISRAASQPDLIFRSIACGRILDAPRPSERRAAAGDPCRRHQRQGLDRRLSCARSAKPAGLRVHVYTSPQSGAHQRALSPRRQPGERRRVGARRCAACERVNAGAPITRVRDRDRAARSDLFAEASRPTSMLLEVGLGGGSTRPM